MAYSKFLVGLVKPTPYIIVSNGFLNRWPSLYWIVNKVPYLTLECNPDPYGSARTTFARLKVTYLRYLDTPAIVPPVPAEHTNASIFFNFSNISGPVCW